MANIDIDVATRALFRFDLEGCAVNNSVIPGDAAL